MISLLLEFQQIDNLIKQGKAVTIYDLQDQTEAITGAKKVLFEYAFKHKAG